MKHLILTATITSLVLAMGMGVAQAKGKGGGTTVGVVIDDDMSRRGPDTTSGSGDTVEANCFGATVTGTGYGQDATATLNIKQEGGSSKVVIQVEDAIPNTHFTVWLRIKGSNPTTDEGGAVTSTGYNPLGSPWTGGGATPLCSGTEFSDLNANSPWNNAGGSADPLCNSFATKANGSGTFKTTVNFPVVGGAYPFQQSGGATARPGHDVHADVPTAIVDPRTGTGGPFMIRVVSHCLDQSNHGLSPATRETWFQYP